MINTEEYLDVNIANYYFEKERLLHAKILYEGDIESCLNYSNEFESTISKDLDLPKLDNNICEGVIIRPIKNVYFKKGYIDVINKLEKKDFKLITKSIGKVTAKMVRKICTK